MPDTRADPAYAQELALAWNLAAVATLLQAPMIKDNDAVGMISMHRQEVRPFTE